MAAITTQEFEHHFKSLYKPLCLFCASLYRSGGRCRGYRATGLADVWDKNRAGNVIGNLKAYLYQAVRNRSLSFTSQPVNAEATEQLPDVEDTSEEEDILRSERDARPVGRYRSVTSRTEEDFLVIQTGWLEIPRDRRGIEFIGKNG